jgi:7-cyano-7-deazaguanine tRNA-ribosyltransferase
MLIIPGISLKNLNPRFWDPESEFYMPEVKGVMISYADFYNLVHQRQRAMDEGIHQFLGIRPHHVQVYLDNGAFHFLTGKQRFRAEDYVEFVKHARPDWYPIPQDFIPTPNMAFRKQKTYFERTMEMNLTYQQDGFIPIIHVGKFLEAYLESVKKERSLASKPEFGLGGLVPNLLRTPKAASYDHILESIRRTRVSLKGKKIHVFGIGGVSTLHLAALLGLDSADSSGWRNRAARGIIQLPGKGDRVIKKLGSWNIRPLSKEDRKELEECDCPACSRYGLDGLKAPQSKGFHCRAIHNLYVLFQEQKLIEQHLRKGTYAAWYQSHISNSTYKPLIDQIINSQE